MRAAALSMILFIHSGVGAAAQQFSEASFCRAMQEFAAKSNMDAGTKVDSVTTHVGLAVLCNSKLIDFKKRLDIPFTAMKAGWEGRKQDQWNQIYCNDPTFAAAIRAGWRVSYTMTDSDGRRLYAEAECK